MRILGLIGDGKNPAACLIDSGELVALIEEERVNRYKNSHNLFPAFAVKNCLSMAGLKDLEDIDAIAWGWDCNKYPLTMLGSFAKAYVRSWGKTRRPYVAHPTLGDSAVGEVLRRVAEDRPARRHERIRTELRRLGIPGPIPPVHFFNHHLSHAASTYYLSGFEDAAIVVIDGSGEDISTTIFQGRGDTITPLDEIPIPDSLGWYYAAFTELLGFEPYSDEGKLMGLAAFGHADPRWTEVVDKVLQCHADGTYSVNPRYTLLGNHYYGSQLSDELVELCGILRGRNEELTDDHRNLAFAVQQGLEKAALGLVRRALERSGSKNLCLAGGVSLNCKMNGVLRRNSGCQAIFVQPAANDVGTALGAALLLSHQNGQPVRFRLEHTHYGPGFDNDEIKKALDICQQPYQTPEDITGEAAKLILQDKIVGWFQGRMEFGSRALGGRSILANPFIEKMDDKVNRQVKFREPWRPFCPSMAKGQEEIWLKDGEEAPFMIVAYDAKEEWISRLPSVVHVDGSVRPQTVSGTIGPLDRPENRYRALLDAIGKETGAGIVLNTSFNVRGEPIVCTPLDAIRCFAGTGIDALVIGDYLLYK